MSRHITPATTLEHLQKEAKRWLKVLRGDDADAHARFALAYPGVTSPPTLRDVQHAIAREHGLPGWAALRARLDQVPSLRRYEQVADALVRAYAAPDRGAIRIVWSYFGHMRAWDGMRRYVRLDLGKPEQPPDGDTITLEEARALVARAQGFASWQALAAFATSVPRDKATIVAKAVRGFVGDETTPDAVVASRDWDEMFARVAERRLTGLHAAGQMTDAVLERFSALDHLTTLSLGGSSALTDAGLRHLARLPELRHLNLSSCNRITDRGLEVLRELPALESIELSWTPITDAGLAHLERGDRLRVVNLMGTATGDGAIRTFAGKSALRDFRSGNIVTDAGLARLQEIPVFATWLGGDVRMSLTGYHAEPNYLLLRGQFTDSGLAALARLDGLFALNLDDERLRVTGAGLAPLTSLPHLGWLAFAAKDDAMSHIAAMPHLRFLMCQDTTASDEGFVALGRSRSIEYIWGRRSHNLRSRGFTALAEIPTLRALSVSCLHVDDAGLSALPRFPALQELMPMDVADEGYRHIGRCEKLESLVLMYCRETGDVATSHITDLPRLRTYFASYNRVTDRTPELLSGIPSLEAITFDTCVGLTNAGVSALATLPRLRYLRLSGMPGVTSNVATFFPAPVEVSHSP